MLRPVKLDTPAEAAIMVVPESAPLPGFVEIDNVTIPVADVTVFPRAS